MLSRLKGRKLLVFLVFLIVLVPLLGILVLPRLWHGSSSGQGIVATGGTDQDGKAWSGSVAPQLAKWSQPSTWNGTVPAAGSTVTIPAGKMVLLDISPPPLKSLTIQGTLVVAEADLNLSADWIMVSEGGKFFVGTEAEPFAHRFVLTLTGNNVDEDIMTMGTKFLGVAGSTLELHGQRRVSWLRLGATAQVGATQITLEKPVDWSVGNRIAIASTDYDPLQAEEVTIKAISGSTITLDRPLKYMHWGQMQTYGGINLDERAEVGLLSHNIVVQGDDSSQDTGFGGQTMFMGKSAVHIEGVEFFHMGQVKRLARYPLHWHLAGNAQGQYVKNSTIDHSFNRCVTIHGTSKLLVQSTVAFDTIGHCYFLEDGIETENVLENNLGFVTRKPAEGMALLQTDNSPATFWITNPNNVLRGNVAAGSQTFGFWYAMPVHPMNMSQSAEHDRTIWPRYTPLGVFSDNVAHSNESTALQVDGGATPDGGSEDGDYFPRQNPAEDSPSVAADFKNLTAYKQRELAIWLRGVDLHVTGAKLADNADGAIFAANETFLDDSLVVGESDNKGNPGEDEARGQDGRSIPRPWDPATPITGFSFYDGRVGARNVTFANFQTNSQRPSGALSFNRSNSNPVDVRNFVENVHFVNANQVYIENPHPDHDGDKGAVILDQDGSLTGRAGEFVVANNPFLADGGCNFKQAWNSYVCGNRYIFFSIGGQDGRDVAPLVVKREDGVEGSLAGMGSDYAAIPMIPGRSYTLKYETSNASRTIQLDFSTMQQGDWIGLVVPYSGSNFTVYRDAEHGNVMSPVQSLAELNGSDGSNYFYDQAAGLLYFKAVPQDGHDWARINVEA